MKEAEEVFGELLFARLILFYDQGTAILPSIHCRGLYWLFSSTYATLEKYVYLEVPRTSLQCLIGWLFSRWKWYLKAEGTVCLQGLFFTFKLLCVTMGEWT